MKWLSRFRKSANQPVSTFDKLIADSVEQAKAGRLTMDHQNETAAEVAVPDEETARKARDLQSALSEEYSPSSGDPASTEAGAAIRGPETPDHLPEEPDAAVGPGDKRGTGDEPGNGALSTRVKRSSRAERDMAAMKQAPDLKAMVHKEVVAGSIAVGVFAVFLVGWSAMAPLSSAAIAPGVISPHGSRKTVQHLEGGIIKRILVQEGERVEAGDTLVLLEDTMARASWQLIRTQYFTLAARHARLGALQSGADEVYFPDWLVEEAGDPDVASILATEINLLGTRREAHHDRKAVLQQRIVQLEKEIDGLNAQINGQTRQLVLIAKEIKGVQTLVDKGLERTPRLLGLQRTEAQIRSQKGANKALVSRTEQAISETELELIAADTVLQDEIAREMAGVQTELSQAGERMAASGDILSRIEITAPVDGKVLDLRYHTAGGIIAPGAAILDIVPENEELIIEARVSPMDIDVVYESLTAQIHLSAFAQRNLPMITGTVRSVSADRLLDEVTGQPYFRATVEVSAEEIAKIGDGVTLMAGMPAEVMIVTGKQTLLGYLLKPVADTLRRSFREG